MILRWIALGMAVIALAALCWVSARNGGDGVAGPLVQRASEVPLMAPDGHEVLLTKGPRLVVFGYVGCAEQCPLTLRVLAAAVGPPTVKPPPKITFVDIDPWNDSAEAVARFVGHFPHAEGAIGDEPALAANEAALGMQPVVRQRDVPNHDARIFVLDDAGVVTGALTPNVSPQEIRARLRTMLPR